MQAAPASANPQGQHGDPPQPAPPGAHPPSGHSAQPASAPRSNRALLTFVVMGVALFGAYNFLPWRQWVGGGAVTALDSASLADSASAADSASGGSGEIVEPHIMGNPNGPDAPPLGPYVPGSPDGSAVTITGSGLDDPEMYFQLAASLEQQNSWSFAEGVYRQVIDFAPNNAKAHAGLAGTLLRQGRRDEAVAEAQRAKALGHPGDHWVFRELGE
jgi:hypothetical protein